MDKDKIKAQNIDDKELDNVAGGGCWFGAQDVAPDGHDIGCVLGWWDSWDEYYYEKGKCKYCGGKLSKVQSLTSSPTEWKYCTQCGEIHYPR